MSLSKAQIEEFYASLVWKSIEEKVDSELSRVDLGLENPDPYLHGRAVGRREMLRLFLKYKEILLTESSNSSPYQKNDRSKS